jgi:hypothetical protein
VFDELRFPRIGESRAFARISHKLRSPEIVSFKQSHIDTYGQMHDDTPEFALTPRHFSDERI